MRKRKSFLILSVILILSFFSSCSASGENSSNNGELKVGITVYKQEDKFISCMIRAIEEYGVKKENETNSKITITIADSKGNSTTQNNQVDNFLNQGYDVICVNIVDRTAASVIINKAKGYDIPIIFFNREPVEEDMNLWDKVYYVGAEAAISGRIQGQIAIDEYTRSNKGVDKNSDGKIQYVMLEGEPEHQDSLIRTESTIKKITSVGIEVEKLASDSANWQSSQAYDKTVQWIKEFGDSIEVVFSNNDDMALGAIYAYEKMDIDIDNRPLILGIDGIPEALECIKKGEMMGTVFNDYISQGQSIIDICYDLKYNTESKTLTEIKESRTIKSSYKKITIENIDQYIIE